MWKVCKYFHLRALLGHSIMLIQNWLKSELRGGGVPRKSVLTNDSCHTSGKWGGVPRKSVLTNDRCHTSGKWAEGEVAKERALTSDECPTSGRRGGVTLTGKHEQTNDRCHASGKRAESEAEVAKRKEHSPVMNNVVHQVDEVKPQGKRSLFAGQSTHTHHHKSFSIYFPP